MRRRCTLCPDLILCSSILLLSGCQRRLFMVDTLGTEIGAPNFYLWGHDLRETAPIVVVASVERNEVIAKHVEAARFAGVFLDFHVVTCVRENLLKGDLTDSRFTFFYFADGRYANSRPNPIFKRLFTAKPGSRYVFFLTRDRGALRSVGDVGDYPIFVSTGRHTETLAKGADTGKLLSEILLTPGSGADLDMMAEGLSDYARITDTWSSALKTVELLRNLLSLREPVRSRACGWLVTTYVGQDDCLEAIAEDPSESAEIRQAAREQISERREARRQNLASLEDPALLTYLDSNADSRLRVRQALHAALLGSDRILKQRVCTALRRYYPRETEPECGKLAGRPPR
jgi:hypothetical protein